MIPLGVRSNNPTNLLPSGWQGETGVNEKGFAIFDEMENGLRAAAKNLMAYQDKHGINTIGPVDENGNSVPVSWIGKPGISPGVAARWSTTDQQAYIDYLCAVCELHANDKISLHDANTQFWILEGMIQMENGKTAAAMVTDAQLDEGIKRAAL